MAVGLAVAVWVGGTGGLGAGAGGAGAGSVGTANVSAARIAQSKQAAVNGRPTLAWRKLGLRPQRKPQVRSAANCVINSYGDVRDYFLTHPCRSLKRTLFTLADPDGNRFVVSVSWVRMLQRDDIRPLKTLIDIDGTGRFRSHPRGHRLTVAEGATVTGRPDIEFFQTVVDVVGS